MSSLLTQADELSEDESSDSEGDLPLDMDGEDPDFSAGSDLDEEAVQFSGICVFSSEMFSKLTLQWDVLSKLPVKYKDAQVITCPVQVSLVNLLSNVVY